MSAIDASKPDLKHPDRWAATTNRLRTEGTDHLLTAAGWPGSGAATWADGRPAPRAGTSAGGAGRLHRGRREGIAPISDTLSLTLTILTLSQPNSMIMRPQVKNVNRSCESPPLLWT